MDAQQLNACFGTGFSGVKALKVVHAGLSTVAMPVTDFKADVQEQEHAAEATFDPATGTLTIKAAANGAGVWIPWLGQGSSSSGGKGWGTYTKPVTAATWVATGPFSGCYAVAFSGQHPRFGHIVTPGSGYTVASVDEQIAAIQAATGAGACKKIDMTGSGEGYIFFMKVNGQWVYRRVFAMPGSGFVMQASATVTSVF